VLVGFMRTKVLNLWPISEIFTSRKVTGEDERLPYLSLPLSHQ
jgi:hypothetical protein